MPIGIYKRTKEHNLKLGLIRKGKNAGKNNKEWKGEDASYVAFHQWVVQWKGRPDTCEKCGKSGLTGHKIHWANIDHKYRRVLDDYIRLCAGCHYEYDQENDLRYKKR
jgi:hypothetical protein